MRRLLLVLSLVLCPALTFAQPPTTAQEGFVPASSLPPVEQVPAAPLLIAAYAFFLVLMMFYLWTIWRRISGVEKDMRELQRRQGSQVR